MIRRRSYWLPLIILLELWQRLNVRVIYRLPGEYVAYVGKGVSKCRRLKYPVRFIDGYTYISVEDMNSLISEK